VAGGDEGAIDVQPCEGPYSLCGHSSLLTRNVNAIFHANVDTPNWFVE
jgi:hypothetical protein